MKTRIVAIQDTREDDDFILNDLAVVELWKHGWEPPAGREFRVTYWDLEKHTTEKLHIPARPAQRTATPTQQQLETIILARIAARLDLAGLTTGDTGCAIVQACGDAAEAIHDLLQP